MTLATRLKLTAILCALLTIAVGQALYQAHNYQQKIYKQLNHSMQIQLSIDSLRSQLWIYEEYSDQLSLSELNTRQANLAVELSKNVQWHKKQQQVLDNLNRLNANIRALFNTQILSNTVNASREEQLTSSRLLKAKYSMNIEKMTEDMFRLHQITIAQAKQTQQSLLISVSLVVLLLSILVTLWSSMTLMRFKRGMQSLNDGMRTLASGDLESRISYDMNDEFAEMSNNFNDMKASLQKITIKKEELKLEVARQTQKLQEQQVKLTYLAEHDELTSIYNRRAFIKQIDIAIARNARRNEQAALLFIDLDKFKVINDTLGHQTGDEVLKEIALRLKSHLRTTDFVGRFGGDEFVIWLDYISNEQDIIIKVKQILSVMHQTIEIKGNTLTVGASIGVSQYPQHGDNSNSLVTAADAAMYIAKHDLKQDYFLFTKINS
ncbi:MULTISPECIES: GGDEF domain-containing protein [Pseudomonadati]|uniref:GGDEF domain-containing protein n=1 Tax=Shewanella aestuarii TaxID=1028752 RepID=A0ABT0KYK9_9GAMM|nr:GGDEF domain-containing protein [Shewanella aestuarii]MCL1116547.1 GGDEF domain-containing protein [Shewanella aestuarii]GGN72038.1 diguanylate cyclase [Shewanella aestuarii]